jgi:serine/threonine protein phosphatase PrpC
MLQKRAQKDSITEPYCFGVIDGSGGEPEAGAAALQIRDILTKGLKDDVFTTREGCIAKVKDLMEDAQRLCHELNQGACVSLAIPYQDNGKQHVLIVNVGDSRATRIGADGSVSATLDNNTATRYPVVKRENGSLDFSTRTELSSRDAYEVQARMDMFSQRDPETEFRMKNRRYVLGELGEITGAPEISMHSLEVNKGDTFVFTTDGATQRLPVGTMKDVLSKGGGAKEMLDHNKVKGNPATDNSTVVVARI